MNGDNTTKQARNQAVKPKKPSKNAAKAKPKNLVPPTAKEITLRNDFILALKGESKTDYAIAKALMNENYKTNDGYFNWQPVQVTKIINALSKATSGALIESTVIDTPEADLMTVDVPQCDTGLILNDAANDSVGLSDNAETANDIAPAQPVAQPLALAPLTNKFNNVPMCSGFGQYHTNEPDKPNAKPYVEISLGGILNLVKNPTAVDKSDAQWVIPSTLFRRNANLQRTEGNFLAVWVDIDDHTTKAAVMDVLASLDVCCFVYSSRSSKIDFQKWRVIIPLDATTNYKEWLTLSEIINNKFKQAGIPTDPASTRPAQLCYLPNEGEFYDFEIVEKQTAFDWKTQFSKEIAEKQAAEIVEIARKETTQKQAKERAFNLIQNGGKSPVDAFKSEMPLIHYLEKYGYIKCGDKWLSPNSLSGSAGVSVIGNRWISSHVSDAGVGKKCDSGCSGDVFDLFVHYEHNGVFNDAVKAAGDMFKNDAGETITQQNQLNHMEKQPHDTTCTDSFNAISKDVSPKPKFSLAQFALNGSSHDMRSKMLNDVFVLDGLALLGQSTVIYAKPNSGKTLLVTQMLIKSISDGTTKGENVFYINADDTRKGLVTKLELAEQYGFQMIAPNENGFKTELFNDYIQAMIDDETAHGKIIILDTLKKFTDLMDKKQGTKFGKLARAFVSAGGTLITLAHTNKNRNGDGKVVFGGTSDIVDDCDCAFTLDEVSNDGVTKQVLFENFKNRGDVEQKIAFSYAATSSSYEQLLDSITRQNDDSTIDDFMQTVSTKRQIERDQNIIDAITDAIEQGNHSRTDLISHAAKSSSISKPKITQVLDKYAGECISQPFVLWCVVSGNKNSKLYFMDDKMGQISVIEGAL